MKRIIAAIVAITITLSCEDRLPELKSVEVADIFSLVIDQTEIEANGYSYHTLTTTFTEDVLPEKRKITLTTDIGKFANDKQDIEVIANDKREAVAFIYSTTAGVGKIKGVVDGKYASDVPVSFKSVTAPFTVTCSPLPTQPVQANGIDAYTLTFAFTPDIPEAAKKVTLTTTSGKFADDKTEITLYADQNNQATTTLTNTSIVASTVSIATDSRKYVELSLPFVVPSANFTITGVSGTTVPADNYSTHEIEVEFKRFQTLSDRTILLETTKGLFPNGQKTITVIAGADNKAFAFVKSAEIGIATVKGTYKTELSQETTVNFEKALPETLDVEVPQFSIKAGLENQITITARLGRAFGTPSAGFLVQYNAVDTLKRSIGTFINNKASDAEGKSLVTFSAGPALTPTGTKTYRGKIKILGQLTANNVVMIDSTFVYVTE